MARNAAGVAFVAETTVYAFNKGGLAYPCSTFFNDRNLRQGDAGDTNGTPCAVSHQGGGCLAEALLFTRELHETEYRMIGAYLLRKWKGGTSVGNVRLAGGSSLHVAADAVPPMYFNGLRMSLAALAILPTVCLMDRRAARGTGEGLAWKQMTPAQKKELLIAGAWCGVLLTLGSTSQQIGLSMGAGAGKAGFVTAMYIVLVPLAGIFWRRRIGWMVWVAVVLSTAGLYFLCMQGGFQVALSDVMLLLCAVAYTGHILVVDHFSRHTDCVKMSLVQFIVTAVLCLVSAMLFETVSLSAVLSCVIPIAYAGILSAGVGYTLQILAQRDAEPAIASLLMSMESVFAVLAGWIILGDALSLRELTGCVLMMGGIVLAQLPQKPKAE